jgi:hypothetical protein
MLKQILLISLVSTPILANDKIGKVCFGRNLAKVYSEHTDQLYLKIDDSKKLFFNSPHDGPVLDNLDLDQDHMIKVYFGDQLVSSWPLNFSHLNTKSVIIWRSAGSWRMEPVDESRCQ